MEFVCFSCDKGTMYDNLSNALLKCFDCSFTISEYDYEYIGNLVADGRKWRAMIDPSSPRQLLLFDGDENA